MSQLKTDNEKFLVFIPAYNCEKQIPRVLDQLLDEEIRQLMTECIVVNNRATDGTEAAVLAWMEAHPEMPVTLLRNDENYGLGGSHKVAFRYAAEHGFDYLVVLHGDDQGAIRDLLPLVQKGGHRKYDCCLGARFMKGSRIEGYSKIRVVGNHGFNLLFSLVAGKSIADLGSGLNLYKVESLKSGYYHKFPDTLYFNDCMLLALCHLKQKILFFPISWREEDQVSNNKLTSFGISLLKLCAQYIRSPKAFTEKEWRTNCIENYTSQVIKTNAN